jgi:hypothetical protein
VKVMTLRTPGGKLGTLSVVSTYMLGVVGAAGVVALAIALALGSDFWSDTTSNKVTGVVFFALVLLGAVGFIIMERSPWLGAALGVIGGLSFALMLWWAFLPIVLGIGAAVVAVWRARELSQQPSGSAGKPAVI